jgi:D-tyrosyl-tRNA(Tyr) deacylase
MIAVLQRVSKASVKVGEELISFIGKGYLILLGVKKGDTKTDADFLVGKCAGLRVMEDPSGKMNLSLDDVNGSVIVVSQFTLYGDAQKGNRPSFTDSAPGAEAEPLYEYFVEGMKGRLGHDRVGTGRFGAMMNIELVNEGPVTIVIRSENQGGLGS